MTVVESISLSKVYHRSRVPALTQITLAAEEGEVFTLLGRNGAGKTTFLRIAATQLLPTGGEMRVLGLDVVSEASRMRRRIAVVPQEGSTIGPLTPWDHVYLSLLARSMSRSEAHRRTRDVLEQLELTPYRDSPADSLSGGLRQRIRVAMAVATDAELLFLDEPTLGLDAVSRRRIWAMLRSICKEGRTILLTTHYIDEAEIVSNQVAVIHDGHLVASGTSRELLNKVKEKVRVDVSSSSFSLEELSAYGRVMQVAERWRVLTDDKRASELAMEAMRRGSEVNVAPIALEDLFVDLVGREAD